MSPSSSSPSSSFSSPSLTSIIQYTVFFIIAYVLAGAPLLSSILGSSSPIRNGANTREKGRMQLDKIESLIVADKELNCDEYEHRYSTYILKREPLVIYVEGFLSEEESRKVVEISEPNWQQSTIWTNGQEHLDTSVRKSQKAPLPSTDQTIACIAERARKFQGWQPSVFIENLWSQRYTESGHYSYHYDFSNPVPGSRSGRVSTFMVYVDGNCTGGGTNFPRLTRPEGREWCRFLECEEDQEGLGAGNEKLEGVTFKPIKGNAVFWENLRSDGSAYLETWHAGLPVKEGVKVGLNIWSWFLEGYEPSNGKQEGA